MRFFVSLFIMLLSVPAFSQDATEIIRKANYLMQGQSSRGTMSMEIIRPNWTREMKMKSWSSGNDYSLVIITEPARDEGTGFLKRDKELWNWQPRIDRVVKMPPSMMMQSWMGSDFTNDDLVRESSIVEDYSHRLLGDTTIRSFDAWKIELIPNEDAPVVWGKVIAYISKANYYQLLIKYFDEDGYLVNTMILSEIKEMGGRTLPTKMEMIPAENPDQKTVVRYQDFEYNVDIPTSFFSVQNLKRANR
jgi:outer membrane lipoprotein-sorting protein